MKKTLVTTLIVLVVLFALGSCATRMNQKQTTVVPGTYDVTYQSRGVDIPATIVIPEEQNAASYPLVVLIHGHGGNRDENVGFPAIATALAKRGIATIRMDFPGCGDSTESFRNNTLSNMNHDVRAAVDYMVENYQIDAKRIGLLGYSMGGRIALELLKEKALDINAVAFLAPAADTQDLKALFGGAENWEALKATAIQNGFTPFTTIFGQVQELSKQWFTDLEADMNPTQAAAKAYRGKALVIYAKDDNCVSPTISEEVALRFNAQVTLATGDSHSYGFYSDRKDILATVVESTADFFATNL